MNEEDTSYTGNFVPWTGRVYLRLTDRYFSEGSTLEGVRNVYCEILTLEMKIYTLNWKIRTLILKVRTVPSDTL